MLVLWSYAHKPAGIHCQLSGHDGLDWSESAPAVVLPHGAQVRLIAMQYCIPNCHCCRNKFNIFTARLVASVPVTGRYYSPRAVQMDDGDVAIVFMNTEGVYFLRLDLAQLL